MELIFHLCLHKNDKKQLILIDFIWSSDYNMRYCDVYRPNMSQVKI